MAWGYFLAPLGQWWEKNLLVTLLSAPDTEQVWGGESLSSGVGQGRQGWPVTRVSRLGMVIMVIWEANHQTGALLSQLFNFLIGYIVWKMVNCYLFKQL